MRRRLKRAKLRGFVRMQARFMRGLSPEQKQALRRVRLMKKLDMMPAKTAKKAAKANMLSLSLQDRVDTKALAGAVKSWGEAKAVYLKVKTKAFLEARKVLNGDAQKRDHMMIALRYQGLKHKIFHRTKKKAAQKKMLLGMHLRKAARRAKGRCPFITAKRADCPWARKKHRRRHKKGRFLRGAAIAHFAKRTAKFHRSLTHEQRELRRNLGYEKVQRLMPLRAAAHLAKARYRAALMDLKATPKSMESLIQQWVDTLVKLKMAGLSFHVRFHHSLNPEQRVSHAFLALAHAKYRRMLKKAAYKRFKAMKFALALKVKHVGVKKKHKYHRGYRHHKGHKRMVR